LAVAGVTIANGGDNVGIYIPLFATLTVTSKVVMISIFFIMTLLWCMMAKYFVRHPLIEKTVDRYGHFITPFVLILLGLFILHESGIMTI
jgi:cadmium resistance protein CadD (predicted permease)